MQTDLQAFIPRQELTVDKQWKAVNPKRKDWFKDTTWVDTVHSVDMVSNDAKLASLGILYIVVLKTGAIFGYR